MTRSLSSAFVLLIVLVVAACTGGPAASPGSSAVSGPGLVGSAWRLTALDGQAPPPGPDVTLRFEADRVSGEAPCNTYSGAFTQDPARGRLQLGPLASTKRACVDQARGALETTWLRALNGEVTARLEGDARLRLTTANGTELSLERIR